MDGWLDGGYTDTRVDEKMDGRLTFVAEVPELGHE